MNDKQVNVDIRADTRQFESGMDRAERSVKDFTAETQKVEAPMQRAIAAAGRMATTIAGAAALIVGVYGAAVLAATKRTIDFADGIDQLSDRLGYTVPQMHAYVLAAERATVPQAELAQGLRTFNQRLDEARQGSKEASTLFARLGIDLAGLRDGSKTVNDVFLEFVDRMAHMEAGAGKTRIANQALGDSGERLIPLFKDGAIGLKSVGEEASRTGGLLDKEATEGAAKFNTEVVKLKQNIGLLGIALTKDLIGPLAETIEKLNDVVMAAGIMNAIMPGPGRPSFGAISNPGPRIVELEDRLQKLQADQAKQGPPNAIDKFFGFTSSTDDAIRNVLNELDALRAVQNAKLSRETLASVHRQITPTPDAPLTPPRSRTTVGGFDAMREEAKSLEAQMRIEDEARELGAKFLFAQDADREKTEAAQRRAEEKYWKEYYANRKSAIEEHYHVVAEANRRQQDSFGALKDAVEGWGRSFSRTMGEAVVTGNLTARSIGDAFQNLAIEIASKQIQKRVTDPLVSLGTAFLDGIFGGASTLVPAAERTRVLIPDDAPIVRQDFADGGVMTARGALPLHRYARGGVAHRPQLAMFGEGDNPEAYVPLPDGRRIPVAMQGSGAPSIVVRIENTGAPKQVSQAVPTMTPEGMVIQLFTTDMMTGGPMSQSMERTFGLGRSAA